MAALLLAAPLLSACQADPGPITARTGSIPLLEHTPIDLLVSAINGRDCSIVRLSASLSYCKPFEPPPEPPPYCLRTLAVVNCYEVPNPFGVYQREVADGPRDLTPEQEARRVTRWPLR